MHRNRFGDPRPATFEEIETALFEVGLLADDAYATIMDSQDEVAPWTGWTADIAHTDNGEPRFATCGFADKEALIVGLNDLGIALIVED